MRKLSECELQKVAGGLTMNASNGTVTVTMTSEEVFNFNGVNYTWIPPYGFKGVGNPHSGSQILFGEYRVEHSIDTNSIATYKFILNGIQHHFTFKPHAI